MPLCVTRGVQHIYIQFSKLEAISVPHFLLDSLCIVAYTSVDDNLRQQLLDLGVTAISTATVSVSYSKWQNGQLPWSQWL